MKDLERKMITMEKLRVLGFDDDNHSLSFRCEDGTVFNSLKDFVDFLSKPHDYHVETKMFSIVDDWKDDLADFEEEEVYSMVDYMVGYNRLPKSMTMTDDLIFELFWNSANRWLW